jgi:uncharacterized protein YdhG (YjbR/CyaY superfamily)
MNTDPRVDAYLATLPADQQALLADLRGRVKALAPQATETISYAMPAFKLGPKFLLSYAGWKRHCSIYPIDDGLLARYADSLAGYGTTKGSLHFTTDQPLPAGLLEDLVRGRIADIESGGG